MKPFLSGCDTNHDTLVTRGEWCRCFQKADRPCTAVTRRANRNHFIGIFLIESLLMCITLIFTWFNASFQVHTFHNVTRQDSTGRSNATELQASAGVQTSMATRGQEPELRASLVVQVNSIFTKSIDFSMKILELYSQF